MPANPVAEADLLSAEQAAKALGVADRPLGPARFGLVTGEDFYRSALEGRPYRARGLVAFGANLVMAHGDSTRGQAALAALDFMVHADLFMSPTAELADVVLPVTSAFEAEGLRIGFEVSQAAQSLVQLRRPVAEPRGEARSDLQIISRWRRGSAWASPSGTATSTPGSATSWHPAGSRWNSSGPSPTASPYRCRPATASTRRRRTASPGGSPRPRAGSSSSPRCWPTTATRRYPSSRSR